MIKKRITIEFIDKAGEFRVNQKSSNGNITHASTEGYKFNRLPCKIIFQARSRRDLRSFQNRNQFSCDGR